MKRWELAKKQGLNWQVVLIQDCETDIKTITLESIKRGEDYGTTNKKVFFATFPDALKLDQLLSACPKTKMTCIKC